VVPPIRLRVGGPLESARRTLAKAGHGADLKRAHDAQVMREARANVEELRHRRGVERRAAVLAARAMSTVREVYDQLDQLRVSDAERTFQRSVRDQILANLEEVLKRGRRS